MLACRISTRTASETLLSKTPEQFKAWSQNLGHEKVLTTFLSYGEVGCQRQGEIIRELATPPPQTVQPDANDIAEAVFKKLRESCADMRDKVTGQ